MVDRAHPRRFETTRWTLIAQAARDEPEAADALAALCEGYWYPLYAYARRRGHDAEEARDLTQGFFADLLERDLFQHAQPTRGRFRSYLLAAFQHYLSSQWARSRAAKRGGGRRPLSLTVEEGEARYALEPADDRTPESQYERQWATDLLQQTLGDLERELAGQQRRALFESLRPFLTSDEAVAPPGEIAARLGLSPGALRVALHRLRRRYGTLLRERVTRTVGDPEEVDDELRHLLAVLSRR